MQPLTLCGKTGLRLREKYLNSSPFLCTWTRSPSYLISEYIPFGHFFIAYSTDLQASACNVDTNNKNLRFSVQQHLGQLITENMGAITNF
jgi:hypothetical protein